MTPIELRTTDKTELPGDFNRSSNASTIAWNTPSSRSNPPNASAIKTRLTDQSIDSSPPRSSTAAIVSFSTPDLNPACITPNQFVTFQLPWTNPAVNTPANMPTSIVGKTGIRRKARTATRIGASKVSHDKLNRPASAACASAIWVVSAACPLRPRSVNKMSVMTKAGTVVPIMKRIWSNSLTPATAGAKFVVSDNGLILSPNNAPETIAPAASAGEIPSAIPIPNKATPTVPTVVKALPVNDETIIVMSKTLGKNHCAEIVSKPMERIVATVPDICHTPINIPINSKIKTGMMASRIPLIIAASIRLKSRVR